MNPPEPTPQHVIDAMVVVSNHLRAVGYQSVVIGQEPGGAIFGVRSILDEKRELLEMFQRVINENNRIQHQRAQARGLLRKCYPFVGWSKPDWFDAEYDRVMKRGKARF